ncbi:signal peptide peptidase SppA [candidate division WOR-3 bacterium]|nr:signal peptide peptidase SppA [candidate division WOR-3 bacterium]
MIFNLLLVAFSLFGENYYIPFTAVPDGPDAGLINPAGLSVQHGTSLRFDIVNTDSAVKFYGDFYLRAGNFSAGCSWGEIGDAYHISFGNDVFKGNTLMAGTTFRHHNGENHLDVGFLSRPLKWISLGIKLEDVFSTQRQYDTRYLLGGAIRPFGGNERFTLSGGVVYEKDADFDSLPYSAGVMVEPVKGLRVSASIDRDERISLGIETSFGKTTFGTAQMLDDENRIHSGISFIRLDSRHQYSLVPEPRPNLILDLGREYPEDPMSLFFFSPKKQRFWTLVESLRKGLEIQPPSCMVLHLDGYTLDIAQTQEIIELVSMYKNRGTQVIAYARNFDDLSYYMACAADKIYIYPEGYMQVNGFGVALPFLARGFDKYGIVADVQYIGEYKSAGEIFVNDSMSDPCREQFAEIINDNWDCYRSSIVDSRNLLSDSVTSLINRGSFSARRALSAGLVDGLMYEDEFENYVKDNYGRRFKEATYISEINYRQDVWERKPKIALIVAEGSINTGESGINPLPFLGGKVMGSETLVRIIKSAREDDEIVAVVMRVNSPGGDALASDLIWREVTLCAQEKPFIISMGGVAGSGGYYISCGADRIFCDPGTLTGSIGVVSAKMAFSGLLENVGLTFDTISTSENTFMWSGVFPMTEEQKILHREEVLDFYESFVMKVADERGISYDSINAIARGRVWSGHDAVEIGLADEIGGMEEAMVYAAKKAGEENWLETEVVINPGSRSFSVLDLGQALSIYRFDLEKYFTDSDSVMFYDEKLDGIEIK